VARELSKHDDDLADLLDRPFPEGISDRVRFDHSKDQWHIWDGMRWRADKTGNIHEQVRDRLRQWIKDATNDGNGDKVKVLLALFDHSKKEAVLKALSKRPGIAMTGEEWDPHPYLVAFSNGVLDLRDLSFDEHPSPDLLLTRSTRQKWDPDADCPKFKAFLYQITGQDETLVNYLIRVIGYAMFGWQREQKFWMWVGEGQNGKGTLAKVVAAALGDYADTPSAELYMKTRFGSARSDAARPDLLRLQGVRWTWMSEPAGGQFNEEMLKAHTGDDPIQARDLFGKAASFSTWRPTHTVIFLTNNPPRTEDVGASMQRRARVVKFEQDFRGEREVKGLEDVLKKEAPGILALLASAARFWWTDSQDDGDGLQEPAKVTAWSSEYIAENDPLVHFIEEWCVVGKEEKAPAAVLFASYQDWCARKDTDPMSQTGFGLALGRRFLKERGVRGATYRGIRPRSAADADSGE
jgi:putative DNA primase/helicase